jgi:hypothetical protein
LFLKFAFAQKDSLVGGWYWSDSTRQSSMFFDQDGSFAMHTGPKGGVILGKNLKKGNYVLKNNLLEIKWVDGSLENSKIKFIDKNTFQIVILDKEKQKDKGKIIFRKVTDEVVTESKSQ